MMRSRAKTLAVVVALLLPSAVVGAHRLDEYLQATLVGIDANRVSLEIDLTAGVSIAKQVVGWIDTNGDGNLSPAEALTYGKDVLTSVTVTADRIPVTLTLQDVRVPAVDDMAAGVGTIQLRASGDLPRAGNGRHELTVVNTHRPQTSVYLSNTLVPSDNRIQILTQQRDWDQHRLAISYDIETTRALRRISWVTGALGLLGIAVVIRGGLGRFRPRRARPV